MNFAFVALQNDSSHCVIAAQCLLVAVQAFCAISSTSVLSSMINLITSCCLTQMWNVDSSVRRAFCEVFTEIPTDKIMRYTIKLIYIKSYEVQKYAVTYFSLFWSLVSAFVLLTKLIYRYFVSSTVQLHVIVPQSRQEDWNRARLCYQCMARGNLGWLKEWQLARQDSIRTTTSIPTTSGIWLNECWNRILLGTYKFTSLISSQLC